MPPPDPSLLAVPGDTRAARRRSRSASSNEAGRPSRGPSPYSNHWWQQQDKPPAYRQVPELRVDPDEMLPPGVLVLHGRFVYPERSAGVADSEPLYELSRVIHHLLRRPQTVDFRRVDYRVRMTADGEPAVFRRARDLYTMFYKPKSVLNDYVFHARLDPDVPRRMCLGTVEIASAGLFRPGYRALRVLSESERARQAEEGRGGRDEPNFHFSIRRRTGDVWVWLDPAGTELARYTHEKKPAGAAGGGGSGDEEHRLAVLVPLPRRTLDGLVATWCLWIWHLHITRNTVRKTWKDRQSSPLFSPPWYHCRSLCRRADACRQVGESCSSPARRGAAG